MEVSPARKKKSGKALTRRATAVIICFFLLNANPAWGRARQFIPKYASYSGTLYLNSLTEKDKTKARRTSSRSNTFFTETLELNGYGYIYNPLFISMQTSIGLGLKQERVVNPAETYTVNGDANSFTQKFKILPYHPYNLELYFKRTNPITAGRTGESGSVTLYEYGAQARYEQRPWASTLAYTVYETKGTTTNESRYLRYNLNYFQKTFNAGGHYSHNENSRDDAINDSSRDMYGLTFNKKFDKVRITSRWNNDERKESETTDGLATSSNLERQELHGAMQVELPLNFNSTLSYDSINRDDLRRQTESERLIFSDSKNYSANLRHRLFKSLSTSYNFGYNTVASNGGETKQQSHRLSGDYAKKIRSGKFFSSLWTSLSDLDSKGSPRTLFEQHSGADFVGNIFALNFKLVDEDTIEVSIVDHNDNDRLVPLIKGVDYQIISNTDPFEIDIFNWPPTNGLADLISSPNRTDYTYQVNYAFLPAEYVLRTTNWGGSLSWSLFDELLTPRYSYSESRQKELEGDFPGNPARSKNHLLGLGFQKRPFRGDMSLSWLRSNTTSEDRFRAFLSYRKNITPFTSGNMTFRYENGDIKQNDQTNGGTTTELNEKIYSAQAQVQTTFPQKNMNASINGNYSLYRGSGDATTLSLLSALVWRLGKLDLEMSASYTDTESSSGDTTTKRQHTLIRVKLKRELF